MAVEASPDLAAVYAAAPAAADWLVVLPLALCLGGGAVALMLRHRGYQRAFAMGVLAVLVALVALLLARVLADGPVAMTMGRWRPPFGITFAADVFGTSLALVGAVVALLAAVHAGPEVNEAERRYGFYPLLLLLTAGVMGSFLTGDLFNLYVWFEVLLIGAFGLLVIGSERAQVDGTVKYAVLNLVATTVLLIAITALYGLLGTLNMADIPAKVAALEDGAPIGTIAVLFLIAFGMKAAAFPLQAWLPASYHTPRLVVSALFAGLLTKVGVYALLKTLLMLLPAEAGRLSGLVTAIAALTMLTGALGALAQRDLRRLAGYLVISGIGNMLIGLGLGTARALEGAVFYAVHSMLVSTGLFMAAGLAVRFGGTGDLNRLGGLYARRPLVAALFLVPAFAIAGLPPLSGFWPKLILTDAAIASGHGWLAAAVLIAGLLSTLAVGRAWLYAFWRNGAEDAPDDAPPRTLPEPPARRAALALYGPTAVLAAATLLIGLVPGPVFTLASGAAAGLLDPQPYVEAVFGGGTP